MMPKLAEIFSLLQSGQYSDLAICSSERRYEVHKAIVCTQSTFFKTACASGFKVCDVHCLVIILTWV